MPSPSLRLSRRPYRWAAAAYAVWQGVVVCLGWCAAVALPLNLVAAEPRAWPVELSIHPFKIHSDFPIDSTEELSSELIKVSRDLNQLLHVVTREQTVHIVLFQSAAEYQRYMRTYFPGLPERRALYIQDRGPGMLFTHWHAEVAQDLRHEVTHALLNQQSCQLPLWLDEGLAEYFEVKAELRFQGNAYLAKVRDRARQGFIPSLRQLEQIEQLEQFGDAQYRDSWSWVHYLLHRNVQTRELLIDYLRRSREGIQPLDLSRQLAALSSDLSADYQHHFMTLISADASTPSP